MRFPRYQDARPTAWGVDVTGVTTRSPTRDKVVALTLDAGGGPHGSGYDATLIGTLVLCAKPGAIVLAHANHPEGGTAAGLAAALPRLLGSGLRFVRLSEYL